MPSLRPSTLVSLALLLTAGIYLAASISHLPARQYPHNLAYDTEDTIDELMWKTPYKGRDYFSSSADIYDRDALSHARLLHTTNTDKDAEHTSWLRDQIAKQEAENLAAWREQRDQERQRELARLDREGGQDDFQSFDPLAQNPVRNPVRVPGFVDPAPGSVSTQVVTPVVAIKRRPKGRYVKGPTVNGAID